MDKIVTYVKTHQGIFLPGLGTLGDTLVEKGTSSKTINWTMTLDEGGVSVRYGQDRFFIPNGNIAVVKYREEAVESVKAPQAKKVP